MGIINLTEENEKKLTLAEKLDRRFAIYGDVYEFCEILKRMKPYPSAKILSEKIMMNLN